MDRFAFRNKKSRKKVKVRKIKNIKQSDVFTRKSTELDNLFNKDVNKLSLENKIRLLYLCQIDKGNDYSCHIQRNRDNKVCFSINQLEPIVPDANFITPRRTIRIKEFDILKMSFIIILTCKEFLESKRQLEELFESNCFYELKDYLSRGKKEICLSKVSTPESRTPY
jgi:hypothetical protein